MNDSPASTRPANRRFPRNLLDWVWTLFLVWTAVGFVVMPLGLTGAQVRAWNLPLGLGDAAAGILRVSDAVWMAFAAVTVYLHAVASEGLPTARRQAVIILLASTVFEWIGARTGFPFGPYEYTENYGPRIGGVVPMAIPLAWLVVILCGRNLVLALRPYAGRFGTAAGVAVVAVLTDLNLEPVAWHVREYWLWYPNETGHPSLWPPWQNYAAWLILSFALTAAMPIDHALRPRRPGRLRPILVLGLLNALLAVVHLTARSRTITRAELDPAPAHGSRPNSSDRWSRAGSAASATGSFCPSTRNCWYTRCP